MTQSNMDEAILAEQIAKRQQIKKISFILLGLLLITGVSWGVVTWIGQMPDRQSAQVADNTTQAQSNESNDPQLREILQRMLAGAEASISDIEAHSGKQHWNSEGIAALRNHLQIVLGHYSAGEYLEARKQIDALQSEAVLFESEHFEAWNTAWHSASAAFEQQEITSARLYNQQTLTLNPDYEPALSLQQKLDSWDELMAQREALHIAEVENNIPNQIASLQNLVVLESDNPAWQEKLLALETAVKDNAFAISMQNAINALEKGQLDKAQTELDRAQQIDSGRHEVAHIQTRLNQQQQLNSEVSFGQQIEVMAYADNWAAVLKLSEKALQAHPKHSEFDDYAERATQILNLKQQINSYLARPERLSDANIASNVDHLLTHNQHWFQESPSLAGKANELAAQLENNNQPLDVVIYSDGNTDIRVLGTGVVGKVKEKVIQLLPGTYRLEGRRQGYQSKIVTLAVQPGNAPLSVQLICDEKI